MKEMVKTMIAQTPPMGWNSWDCYGAAVDEATVRKNAEYMAKNLKEYGWEYVVVDIQWFQPTATNHEYVRFADLVMDEYSRLLPAENRFPSAKNGAGFKPLSDYIHSLGLKFGIHILRGIPRQAAHQNTKILGTSLTARQIAMPNSICNWNPDMYGVDANAEGADAYYDSLFELYADWGVDFVKVDDIANHYAWGEIELIKKAIDKSGREMVLSISPGPTPLEKAEHLKQYVNMWRITDDFWDKWELLYDMFSRAEKWCTHSMPGHWPDADMLPIGAIIQDYDTNAWTKFTKDEQITMMTLWCMMRSPLMIGGEMTKFDDFTLSLLTNNELLALLSQSHSAHQVYRRGEAGKEEIVWIASAPDNIRYLAIFNADDSEKNITVNLTECGITDKMNALNIWDKSEIVVSEILKIAIPSHGAKLYKLS